MKVNDMDRTSAYEDFKRRLKLIVSKHPDLITITLSNIFTMRLIGNKTHGDLAEIAIMEFINQYMYDFQAEHVGKDLYRATSTFSRWYTTREGNGATSSPLTMSVRCSTPL